jgi:hypothetical protein
MQRLSRDVRDNDDSVSRAARSRSSCDKEAKQVSSESEKNQRLQQSRTVVISAGHSYQTTANLDASGEFDTTMGEWTVYFLERDQPSFCPAEAMMKIDMQIGNDYRINFVRDSKRVHVRIHNVESQGEKSVVFTIGNELMLLGRITGCPEERSPNSDEDAIYEGDLPSLLTMLRSEEMCFAKVSFGCVIFKDYLLKDLGNRAEEEKSNWENFE